MKAKKKHASHQETKLIKVCHVCSHIMESKKELDRCSKCRKSFLPINYTRYDLAQSTKAFHELFHSTDELHEEDLVKGLNVIW
jgi:hypothetical protein